MGCIYLNTSILIRALEDPRARRFLEECCRRYRCVISDVHWYEPWREETRHTIAALLAELGIHHASVDVRALRARASILVEQRGWSPRRLVDTMHTLAALYLGCRAIAAVDRFIARRAKEYGLLYVNHYTGCP